jgi:putative membrane protein
MTQPEPVDFSRPSRQSPAAIPLILTRLFRTLIRQFWPVLLVFIFRPQRETLYGIIWIAAILALVSSINSIVSYFFSWYYVSEGELILQKGWINRSRLSVPLERIQSVSFEQTLLHRLFRAVRIEIDTAGGQGAEFSLLALDEEKARALRDFLLENRSDLPVEAERPREKTLLQLGIGDLIKIGLSQNHLRTAGILIALALGLLDDLESVLGKRVYQDLEKMIGSYFDSFWILALSFITIMLFLAFFGTLILNAFRNYQLRFTQTAEGFKIVSGFFARQEQSAALRKIQYIQWSAHPIQRWLGMFSLRLYQAASHAVSRKSTMQIPGCYQKQLDAVQDVYFPEAREGVWEWHAPSVYFFRRRLLFLGILPALAGTAFSLYMQNNLLLPVFLLWGPVSAYWQWRYYRTYRIGLHPLGLQAREGFFTRDASMLRWTKIQGVSLRQSPYQRNRQVANLALHTASGDVVLPYLPLEKARQIRDYALFRAESEGVN